ncbi:MAG TPA: flavin reductase family protein [Acidimicrobiales bacterium]|nr:flavin reductase family protein [Acidimicrobiales bacterium]
MSSAIDQAHYRQVMGHFPTGVVIVTAPGPVGTAIGSFISLSIEPPLCAWTAQKTSSTWPKIQEAGVFCVSVLAEDQEAICRAFAQSGADKFAGIGYTEMPTGSPRINDCTAWMDCDIHEVHDGGDHVIVVGRIREMGIERETKPLLFFRGGYSV